MDTKHIVAWVIGSIFTLLLIGVGLSASGGGIGAQSSPDSDQLLGDGFYQQFSAKNSATHYTEVNEASCNGKSDVVSTATVGARDSYVVNLSLVPIGAQITGIDVTLCVSGEKSPKRGVAQLKTFYRLNGMDSMDYDAPAVSGNSPVVQTPVHLAANVMRANDTVLEVGVLYVAGTEAAVLSQLSVAVTYSALEAPGAVTIDEPSPQALRVRWDDLATTEDGYLLERSLDGASYVEVTRTTPGASEFIDVNLLPSTQYYYRVSAFNAGASSLYSIGIHTTSLLRPATPVKLGAVVRDLSTILLEWGDESTSEEGYWIQRSMEGYNFTNIDQVGKDVATYVTTGTPGVTYYYRVYGYNADWTSEFSNVAKVLVPAQ